MASNKLDSLLGQIDSYKSYPLDKWNPALNGEIDIEIRSSGKWFYQGSEITRYKIVQLFSSILKLEKNEYYLVTPVEKWRLKVENFPFVIVSMEYVVDNPTQWLVFVDNVGKKVIVNRECYLAKRQVGNQSYPVVHLGDGLYARILTSVYYELAEYAEEYLENGEASYRVKSGNDYFNL